MLSAKLNAIYEALDCGDAKSALKLSSGILEKSPNSQIVQALQALAYSRLDQSEKALQICHKLTHSAPLSDMTLVSTIGYTYRRETRYDLLSELYNQSLSGTATGIDNDFLVEAYMSNLYCSNRAALPGIAMRLWKSNPGDKKYLAWYVFSLYLANDVRQDDKMSKLIVATIEKVLVEHNGKSEANGIQHRLQLNLNLFLARIFQERRDVESARSAIDRIANLSPADKEILLKELPLSEKPVENEPLEESPLDRMTAVVLRDASIENNVLDPSRCWISDDNRIEFFSLLREYIGQNHSRSDCAAVVSTFLPLADERNLIGELFSFLHDLCDSLDKSHRSFGQSYVNLLKLMYSIDKDRLLGSRAIDDLEQRAFEFQQTEPLIEECSPAKQLFLLCGLLRLEDATRSSILSALSLLSYGSKTFPQCSHFRLIECIVYAWLGMGNKSVEKFEAMNVKNAQWETLWWLVRDTLERCVVEKAPQLRANRKNYLQSKPRDAFLSLEMMMNEFLFWRYRELKEIASREESESSCSDFSPVLFMALPTCGSSTSAAVASVVKERLKGTSLCCGAFEWHKPASHQIDEPPTKCVSPHAIPGSHLVLGAMVKAITAGRHSPPKSEHACVVFLQNLFATKWDPAEMDDFDTLLTDYFQTTLQASIHSFAIGPIPNMFTILGNAVTGSLATITQLLIHECSKHSSKSAEKRRIKKTISLLVTLLNDVAKSLMRLKEHVRVSDIVVKAAVLQEHTKPFADQFLIDLKSEFGHIAKAIDRLVSQVDQ